MAKYVLKKINKNPVCEDKGAVNLSLNDYNKLFGAQQIVDRLTSLMHERTVSDYFYADSFDQDIAKILGFTLEEVQEQESSDD